MALAQWTGRSRDPAVVSADVARALTAELGLPGPPPTHVLAGDSEGRPRRTPARRPVCAGESDATSRAGHGRRERPPTTGAAIHGLRLFAVTW
ncbi:hypothetical protein [Streptomyces sp. NPDC047981]|uniref:hypothetical protein n=1 Tax=Streptomyces sp. NPDC047981 TaxID=3154610 RepID=UPI0034127194